METLKIQRVNEFNHEKGKYITHIEYLKTCKICTETFWGRKITSTFCSQACRNIDSYRRLKIGEG